MRKPSASLLIFAATLSLITMYAPQVFSACNGNYFHVENFTGIWGGSFGYLVPIFGQQSLWCGVRSTQSGYPSDGYGNNWNECWESCDIQLPMPTQTLNVWYTVVYHTDGKDSLYFESFDGNSWTTHKSYGGGPGGLQDMVSIPPPSNGVIKLRFRFVSDPNLSDQDMLFDSDGAAIIDNIQVIANNTTYLNYEDFECEAPGDQRTVDGVWMAGQNTLCQDTIPCVTFFNTACDSACPPSAGLYPDTVSFEDIDHFANQSIEGLGAVDPLLNIQSMINPNYSSCVPGDERVLQEGSSLPFWAYKSGTFPWNGCFSGKQGFGDPNSCILDYQFTFAPGYKVHCFSMRMLDFGDYFYPYGPGLHQVSLTAYDGSNVQLDQDVLSFTGDTLHVLGDACQAATGDPGNYVFHVQANGIKRVTLTFDSKPDVRVAFDDIVFCGMQDSIPCTPSPIGLRAWWKGDLDTYDESAFNNHGSFVNGQSFAVFPKAGSGAFHLDGSNFVQVPDDPSLDFGIASSQGVGNFSIDAWVLLPNVSGKHPIVAKKPGPFGLGPGYAFYVSDGALELYLMTASSPFSCAPVTSPVVAPGQWTHVAVSVDRTAMTASFFANGAPVGSYSLQSYCAGDMDNPYDLDIGADPPVYYMTGDLDEVEIFARALTQAEINDIYLADYAGKCRPDSFGTGTGDCNLNGIADTQDISSNILHDQDGNEVPDECENKACYAQDMDLIDFGAVAVGDTAMSSFYLRNVCAGMLSGTIAENCTDFHVAAGAGSYNLAAGESLLVTVLFVPAADGSTQCTISTGFGPGIICTGQGQQPVAVLVHDYKAVWSAGRVLLSWALSNAGDNVDFEITRSEAGTENQVRLDPRAISRHGSGFALSDESALPGKNYDYRLGILAEGRILGSMETHIATPIPDLVLYQNQPNPFSGATDIAFSLDKNDRVRLSVYDITGRLIRTLVDKPLEAGWHSESWDGLDASGKPVASGIYIYMLKTTRRTISRKAVLMR